MSGSTLDQLQAAGTLTGAEQVYVLAGTADRRATVTQLLAPHADRTDNPHATTAAQVGAYTIAQTDFLIAARAPLASPAFTGTPTGPTPAPATNSSQLATTAWVWSLPAVQQIADGTIAGGNARGLNATDWQSSRTTAAQVASGDSATIGGGQNNTAAGQRATVGGGNANTASNTASVVAGGQMNTAASSFSTVAGGTMNTASGLASWVPGGTHATTRGHVGRGAWAGNDAFAAQGDAQAGEFVLRRITTDATATRLTADNAAPGTANTVNLPNNGTYRLKLLVVAQQTAGSAGTVGDCASWEANVLIKRGPNAAATAFVGGMRFAPGATLAAITAGVGFVAGLADAGASAWTLTVAADTVNGGLSLTVAGEANKTIRWVCRVLSVEVVA